MSAGYVTRKCSDEMVIKRVDGVTGRRGDARTKRDRETGRWGDAEPSEFMRRSDFHFDRESVLAVSPLLLISPSLPTRVPGKYLSRIL
jgi:hypothetical protein